MACADTEGVDIDDVLGPCRRRPVVYARHRAMFICRRHLGLSYPVIGRLFGRDHTTVMHGVREHGKRLRQMRGDKA